MVLKNQKEVKSGNHKLIKKEAVFTPLPVPVFELISDAVFFLDIFLII